jgi:hypothetical protein
MSENSVIKDIFLVENRLKSTKIGEKTEVSTIPTKLKVIQNPL